MLLLAFARCAGMATYRLLGKKKLLSFLKSSQKNISFDLI
jgi:hypothetical protein